MKATTTFVLTLLLSFYILDGYSQVQQRPIVVQKSLGTTFSLDGVKLTPRQLEEVVAHNPEALQEMKLARRNTVPVTILSYAGGFLVGYPLGSAIGGGSPNWKMAGVGAGLLALSVPFSIGYNRHAQRAAEHYNEGLVTSQRRKDTVDVRLGMSANRLGLILTF